MVGKRQLCLVYSRVVGWMTPLKNWNPGKQQEWLERKEYNYDRTSNK